MKEYLKMSDGFYDLDIGCLEQRLFSGLVSKEECTYAAHSINSHDDLVADVERLRSVLQQCCDSLYIADKFCGDHTADECDDSIAIPIKDALVASVKELTK